MDESENILVSVKKPLGVEETTTEFDGDIRALINGAFFSLYQLGVGPSTPFYISDDTSWSEFDTVIPKDVVLDYIYLKTKLVFDPPTVSSVIDAYKDRISELEFRMNIETDNGGGITSG